MNVTRRDPRRAIVVLFLAALSGLAPRLRAAEPTRQVTVCGIIAVPGNAAIDPKLAQIEPQLRKLLPGHGFKLLDVKSKRIHPGQSVVCNLGGAGFAAEAILFDSLDENGKVRIKCDVTQNGITQFGRFVSTPPNQLFFCDQKLMNGQHLLIGIGAR